MCGIVGYWCQSINRDEMEAIARQMSNTLIHRGPDSQGTWTDPATGIALGHRRLAIVDLSPEGYQPMHSANGRYVLVFNGEIYNFSDLRQELITLGHTFRGYSDTEIMLAAFCQWGIEPAVQKFVGMFAFALWDRKERVLNLGRDRLGEKPLYYGWMGETFLFGSELKALKAHPEWRGEIDRNALALFMRHNYIPAPYSIYQGIYKLTPGTILTLKSTDTQSTPKPVSYWSARSVAELAATHPFSGSETEAIEQLDSLLRDAIRQQMVADVPLGAFLSGGIDSSTVVALMQAQNNRPVKTFSIGFYEDAYNEAKYAKEVARHLGTDHTELYLTPEEAISVIPKLPTLYDEPFSDSSQIPTFLLSQLAKQQVTVSLSGDGGDELFSGYQRYFLTHRIWQQIGWMPSGMRQALSRALITISPQTWNFFLAPWLPGTLKRLNPGDKLHKLADVIAFESPEALYRRLLSHWKDPNSLVLGASEPTTALNHPELWADLPDLIQSMMYLDTVTYLPNDILTKVDRATMGVSLEARVPLLNHRVVEFAWRLPMSMKINNRQGKWLLRQVLYKYVPSSLIERPKMGFGIPLGNWLRGSLRDWAEVLLNESRLRQEGFLNPQPIRQKWEEHLAGDRNWQAYLWDVLIFQAWLDDNNKSLNFEA